MAEINHIIEKPHARVDYNSYVLQTGITRGMLAGLAGLGLGLILAVLWMITYLSEPSAITNNQAMVIGFVFTIAPAMLFMGYVGYGAVTNESIRYDAHNITTSEKVQTDAPEQIAPPVVEQLTFQIRSYNGELQDHNHSNVEGTEIELFNLGKWLVAMGERTIGATRNDSRIHYVADHHYVQIRQLFEANKWIVKNGDASNSRVVVTPIGERQAQANGSRLMKDLRIQ